MGDAPDVLYIMGTARSGTTILEILLGANPGHAGVGELKHIFDDGFRSDDLCSCGRAFSECQVWAKVSDLCRWTEGEVRQISAQVRRTEAHSRFPLVASGLVSRRDREHWRSIHDRLLSALSESLDARVLVDSSQYASRALLLARTYGERVGVICLTRSPAGLMNAFGKPNPREQRPKSALGVLLYYSYVVTCARVATWILGDRVLEMSFEELRKDPVGALGRIQDWSGHDLSIVAGELEREESIPVGHIVTGNRLRKSGRVTFRRGAEAERVEGFFRGVAARVMTIYGRLLGF